MIRIPTHRQPTHPGEELETIEGFHHVQKMA